MKGLIIYDLLVTLKRNYALGLVGIIYFTIYLSKDSGTVWLMLGVLMLTAPMLSNLVITQYYGWERMAAASLSKKKFVVGKYLTGLILITVTLVLAAAVIGLGCLIGKKPASDLFFLTILPPVTLLITALTLLTLFAVGKKVGPYAYSIIIVLIILVGVNFSASDIFGFVDFSPAYLYVGFWAVSVALYLLSMAVSLKLYEKKDL